MADERYRIKYIHGAGVYAPFDTEEERWLRDDELIAMLNENERIRALVSEWQQAYPLSAFPEPDKKEAHRVLKENGMTLDAVSASMARHVLARIAEEFRGGE